jgi:DMSO/TMAO reductase YedYZ molybdopterin-dependent catalytic subunit
MAAYHLSEESAMNYLGLSTPDEEYYVGIDMRSAMHPQTLLCYEMNGNPLPMNQGYPLRLIIPVKYGIKSLKRIGSMYFNNERPTDYWAEKGYDYFSGL